MNKALIEKIVDEGICSMESIEETRRLAESLDSGRIHEKILESEQILKALADRNRIKILMLLERGEMCVCQITAATDAPQPTVSNTLRVLENAHLVNRTQRGRWHFYSLADNRIIELVKEMLSVEQ